MTGISLLLDRKGEVNVQLAETLAENTVGRHRLELNITQI